MPLPLFQVDAFADEPFLGNPAAVCLMTGPRDERWMQHVGREMNLSETAFLYPEADGHRLRWFTPAVEVDLCGHATLASAHVLWEDGRLRPGERAVFYTRSGRLTAERRDDWIEMDFPSLAAEPFTPPFDMSAILCSDVRWTGKNPMDYLVELVSEDAVRSMEPDIVAMQGLGVRGVIVTAKASTAGFDFVSRFFAPGAGLAEDPVTGSAHCCLAPYWREKLGKDEMLGYQASERGGVVGVRVAGDRTYLRGKAVTVLRGELLC
jgi:PhzF family phenazine biosynthesis protein